MAEKKKGFPENTPVSLKLNFESLGEDSATKIVSVIQDENEVDIRLDVTSSSDEENVSNKDKLRDDWSKYTPNQFRIKIISEAKKKIKNGFIRFMCKTHWPTVLIAILALIAILISGYLCVMKPLEESRQLIANDNSTEMDSEEIKKTLSEIDRVKVFVEIIILSVATSGTLGITILLECMIESITDMAITDDMFKDTMINGLYKYGIDTNSREYNVKRLALLRNKVYEKRRKPVLGKILIGTCVCGILFVSKMIDLFGDIEDHERATVISSIESVFSEQMSPFGFLGILAVLLLITVIVIAAINLEPQYIRIDERVIDVFDFILIKSDKNGELDYIDFAKDKSFEFADVINLVK